MRQELRKAKTCPSCHRITYDAEYSLSCDACGKTLNQELKDGNHQYLDLEVFPNDNVGEVDHLDFCDWVCTIRWLRQNHPHPEHFGFIKLPYLHPRELFDFLDQMKPLPPVKP